MFYLFYFMFMLYMIYFFVKAKCILVVDIRDIDIKNLLFLVLGKLEICFLWLFFVGFGICRVFLIFFLSISIG